MHNYLINTDEKHFCFKLKKTKLRGVTQVRVVAGTI